MNDHTPRILELHAELVHLLNSRSSCGSCTLNALAMTVTMAIMRESSHAKDVYRLAGAFNAELADMLGKQLAQRNQEASDAQTRRFLDDGDTPAKGRMN